jgi:solute:Na+ symporter, SSS family
VTLHAIDVGIIVAYFVATILLGFWVSRRGAKDLDSYFLGGKSLPWYLLGISDASGMFDITGTMWLVYVLFVYGLKSLWLPWLWPTFNQVFLMMFLSGWVRRSNVMTGAQWIETRFGRDRGASLAHLSVVLFALVNVVGMLAYAFIGIGKFAVVMLPWRFTDATSGLLTNENVYAVGILLITSVYAIKGGMFSVVSTEVMQFTILTVTALSIGVVAIATVSPGMVLSQVPAGWTSPFFGLHLGLDWTGVFDKVNDAIRADGNELFAAVFGLMFFKGVLASLAGPAPNYDLQRVLATRNPREACLMNGMVNAVLYFPRYLMVAGLTAMAFAFCMPELRAMDRPDFEKLLPLVLARAVPVGVLGLLLAGLLAAFMSNFAATVNAAPAYIVNDIYKRFIRPDSPPKTDVLLSRAASVAVLLAGLSLGLLTTRITGIMMWIVAALYGGFVVANVLKWYWWRFNGYGYFWGMVAGIGSAMVVPPVLDAAMGRAVNAVYTIPFILVLSTIGCVLGTLLTAAEDDTVLTSFYRTVRPWGFWGPIRDKVLAEDPSFVPNGDFLNDCTNVAVGIVWQVSLAALPIYIVLRQWSWVTAIATVTATTSVFLKFNWYDKLETAPEERALDGAELAATAGPRLR